MPRRQLLPCHSKDIHVKKDTKGIVNGWGLGPVYMFIVIYIQG